MRKILVVALALLLLAPQASAKLAEATRACGAGGCRPIDSALTDRLMGWGAEVDRRPRGTPFYRIRFAVYGPEHERLPGFSIVWVPRARLLLQEAPLGNTSWFGDGHARPVLRQVTMALRPYPAAQLSRLGRAERFRVKRAMPPGTARSEPAEGPPLAAGAGVALLGLAVAGLVVHRRRR